MDEHDHDHDHEEEEEAFLDPESIESEFILNDQDAPENYPEEEGDEDMLQEGEEGEEGTGEEEDMIECEEDDSTQAFFDHTDSVYSVSLCHNNSLAVSGGGDDCAFIWDSESGDEKAKLEGHTDSVVSTCFNHSGEFVATASLDCSVKIWKTDGTLVSTCEGPGEGLEWVKWHPRGNVILAGSGDCSAWMWLSNGNVMRTMVGHSQAVTCGNFTPDGKLIYTGSDDGSLRVWNPKDATCIFNVNGNGFHTEGLTAVDCNNNSNLVISAGQEGNAYITNIATGKVVGSLAGHEDSVEDCKFCPMNNTWAATGSLDKKVIVWDLSRNQLRTTLNHEGALVRLGWHPTQPLLYTCSVDKTVGVWDVRTGDRVHTFRGHAKAILDMSWRGTQIATASDDKSCRIFSFDL